MIRWNGWTTDRVRHWEYEAESAYELYSILCLNEVISYLDLDLDNETFTALSYVDTSGYLDSMRESLEELYAVDYSDEEFDILYSCPPPQGTFSSGFPSCFLVEWCGFHTRQ